MLGTKQRCFEPGIRLSLADLVPAHNFYRRVHETLDLAFVHALVRDKYALGGRPSIDPVVFFKLQLVMFFEGIRSERQLLQIAADRLSVRWYLGYDLMEALPDHSSLTRIRDRYGIDVFRKFFDTIVDQCQKAGLVWGHDLYFDATQVKANASLNSTIPRFAVDAHLKDLFPEEGTVAQSPPASEPSPPPSANDAGAAPAAEPSTDPAAPLPLPVTLSTEARQELGAENAAKHNWITSVGQQNRTETHGHYQRIADFMVSTTDPDATVMHLKGGGSHYGYHTHYAVDGGKARIIVMALVTPAEVMENQPMRDLLWRIQFRWKLRPCQVTGDTTYGTAENIVAVEQAGIRAYVPLPDFDARSSLFGKQSFRYDAQKNVYICPQGESLPFETNLYGQRVTLYQAKAETCNACPLKAKCTTTDTGRTIQRSFDEEYLDRVRSYHKTAAYARAMGKRKVWVEPLFGEAKDWHGLRRFRLRTLVKVNCEALLTASGQNIKRLLAERWRKKGGSQGAALSAAPAALFLLLKFCPV